MARGYRALKFDPFGTAWKVLSPDEIDAVVDVVAAVRDAVGPDVGLMIEFHGRLGTGTATAMIRRLERFQPAWCEEPVAPECLDLLAEIGGIGRLSDRRRRAALYPQPDFYRLTALRRRRYRPDGPCPLWRHPRGQEDRGDGGSPRISFVAPHCSIGPVALAACLHFDILHAELPDPGGVRRVRRPLANDLVGGWNPIHHGEFVLSDAPGLGLDLDESSIDAHPYVANAFPSLWDGDWQTNFTQRSSQ